MRYNLLIAIIKRESKLVNDDDDNNNDDVRTKKINHLTAIMNSFLYHTFSLLKLLCFSPLFFFLLIVILINKDGDSDDDVEDEDCHYQIKRNAHFNHQRNPSDFNSSGESGREYE